MFKQKFVSILVQLGTIREVLLAQNPLYVTTISNRRLLLLQAADLE